MKNKSAVKKKNLMIAAILTAFLLATVSTVFTDADAAAISGAEEKASPERQPFELGDLEVYGLSISLHQEADVITLFGDPMETIEVYEPLSMDYHEWKYLLYDGFTATVVNYEYPTDDFILNRLEINGEGIPGPRGIEIGDSVESVLGHFPDEGNQVEAMQEVQVKYLYGSEYAHKGVVYYDEDHNVSRISFVYFIDTSLFADFELEIIDGKVAGMSIMF